MNGGFEELTAIATTVIALAMIVLVGVVLRVVLELRRSQRKIDALFNRAEADIKPVIDRFRQITDNVGAITESVRSDMGSISETLHAANDTVRDAVAVTQERLNDFTALLSVVQDEAEGLFVSTASTLRGVRTGAASFRGRSGTDLASDELEAADVADVLDIQEEADGHNDDTESTEEASPAAPRIRPRPRSRRHA